MSPADHDFVQTTVGLVNTVLSRVSWMLEIGVVAESVRIDNLIGRNLASNDKGIANNILQARRSVQLYHVQSRLPLTHPLSITTKEIKELAEVVDDTGHLHPFRLPILAHRLGGLQEMLNLSGTGVRVTCVDQSVKELHCLPNSHDGTGLLEGLTTSF